MPKFIPRERKHKRLAKQPQSQSKFKSSVDSNATELIPASQSEKDERRQALKAQLVAPDTKVTGKKRKRLDHYIDTKLRKEENLELIKKLGAHQVDTSILQSSRKLGRVGETKRERLSRALQEKAAGLDSRGTQQDVLYERRRSISDDDSVVEDEEPNGPTTLQTVAAGSIALQLGSGLKRPLDVGEDGKPVIEKRKRRKKAAPKSAFSTNSQSDYESEAGTGLSAGSEPAESDVDGSEWDGFDSEPSPDSQQSDSDAESVFDTPISSDDEESENGDKPARTSAFKAWADMQRNAAMGFTPSAMPVDDPAAKAAFKPRAPSPDAVAQGLLASSRDTTASTNQIFALTIPRSEEIQNARLELPIVQEEQKIMEAINHNPIVIVCGATGSGKTTQVPQMMLESGYGSRIGYQSGLGSKSASEPAIGPQKGMIGVTQPRRVAAVSVAARVATELASHGSKVAHQVRYDSNVSRDTAVKFMTDGILLRELSQDFLLTRYSAIVLDEAHERSVNTDILIGMLTRVVTLRAEDAKNKPDECYPLKLVIMSATLRVGDFAQNERLFRNGAPPIVEAEGRQYPVTVHFSRRTQRDYVAETVNKVARGHKKLPPGAILVFLTGQQEIQSVMKSLKDALGGNTAGYGIARSASVSDRSMPLEMDDFDAGRRSQGGTLEGEDSDEDSEADIHGLDEDVAAEDEEFAVPEDISGPRGALKAHILQLYAALPTAQQLKVFQPPPVGSRLIVLATNVAETSLTIPGIRYVFDCGRSKEKKYDTTTGVQTFEIDWISKASASQRSGRAGRTGPGHCYRLYSSAVFEQFFQEHTVPEILRTPLGSTVLQLKAMEIDTIVNFPFPTPPDRAQLAVAEGLLKNLGAINSKGKITQVGTQLIQYPLDPRFGKMLLLGQRNGVLAHTIALVAALAVGDLVKPEAQGVTQTGGRSVDDDANDSESDDGDRRVRTQAEAQAQTAAAKRHQAYTRAQATLSRWDDLSDAMKVLTAVAAHAESAARSTEKAVTFCTDFFLNEKGMNEIQQLRQQLHSIVKAQENASGSYVTFKDTLDLPSEKERRMLNQVVAAGYIDQVAIRSDLLPDHTSPFRKPRRAIEVPYRTLIPTAEFDRSASPEAQELQRSVFIHPSSVLAHLAVKEMPAYVAYSHLSRAAPATVGEGAKQPKTRMHALTAVSAKALAVLAEGSPLLEIGKPIGKIEDLAINRRQCWVGLSLRAKEGSGWPVGAWKVLQKRVGGEWIIEKVSAR